MTNYCYYYPLGATLPLLVRMTELPAKAILVSKGTRTFFVPIQRKPFIRCAELDYCAGSPKIRKLSPRAGKHRRYLSGEFAKYYDNSSHKSAKTFAHRAARRKARIYFRQIDPDGDYNARLNPGLTEWEFS